MTLLTFLNHDYTNYREMLASDERVPTSVHALSEWFNGKFPILHLDAPGWSCYFGTRPGVGA